MQALVSVLSGLKDISPLVLAIAGLIGLGWQTNQVVERNTVAITKMLIVDEKLSNQQEQIMRRLDLFENVIGRR